MKLGCKCVVFIGGDGYCINGEKVMLLSIELVEIYDSNFKHLGIGLCLC